MVEFSKGSAGEPKNWETLDGSAATISLQSAIFLSFTLPTNTKLDKLEGHLYLSLL